MEKLWYWIGDHWAILLVIFASVIQITPFKFNPWSALFGWIGKKLNRDVNNHLSNIDKKIESQQRMIEDNEKDRIRWEVLDFANSCRYGRNHSKDEYQHIVDISDKYHKMLKESGETNGVFTLEYNYIIAEYERKSKDNSFLM